MLDHTQAYGLTFLYPSRDTGVGASLRDYGEFARPETDFLIEMADGAGTYLDVGANIGAMALPFARARPDWRVIAVEGHRELSNVLAANALGNRLTNVQVVNAAVGPERTLVEFPAPALSDSGNFGGIGIGLGEARTETVRMATVDELAPDDTRIVKIDVEGFELEVLKGARATLGARRAVWLAEASLKEPAQNQALIRAFREAGYETFWFYAPFATFAAAKKPADDPARGDANIVALPPGAPNSWALPEAEPGSLRPDTSADYSYLRRYGYP